MGLDVYLYHFEDYAKAAAASEQYEKGCEELWEEVCGAGDPTEEQREELRLRRRALAESLGYSFTTKESGWVCEEPPGRTEISLDSAKHPEHMFKIGYFRSSYNDGGLENVVGNLTGGSGCLGDIFDPDNRYEFAPDWSAALARTRRMIELFEEKTAKGSFRCLTEAMNPFRDIKEYEKVDKARALEMFYELLEQHGSRDGGFSNRDGSFFLGESALKVQAMIPGVEYGRPCVHFIYETDMSWYRQALDVVEETITWVLSQRDPQNYYLHWSG